MCVSVFRVLILSALRTSVTVFGQDHQTKTKTLGGGHAWPLVKSGGKICVQRLNLEWQQRYKKYCGLTRLDGETHTAADRTESNTPPRHPVASYSPENQAHPKRKRVATSFNFKKRPHIANACVLADHRKITEPNQSSIILRMIQRIQ